MVKYHQANMRVRRGFFIGCTRHLQSHETIRISLLRTPCRSCDIIVQFYPKTVRFKCTAQSSIRG